MREEAERRGLRYIDATCPLVTKVHTEVVRHVDHGREMVLIGHAGHDEVLGTMGEVHGQRSRLSEVEANRQSVKLELQADCYAGVWAHHAHAQRQVLESGDLEEALRAAAAIGDDTLQQRSRGRVVPESFTHGTSAERQHWFARGVETGDPAACDTFR